MTVIVSLEALLHFRLPDYKEAQDRFNIIVSVSDDEIYDPFYLSLVNYIRINFLNLLLLLDGATEQIRDNKYFKILIASIYYLKLG